MLIDGHDIRDVVIESLRRQLGVVPQEPFLFAGTIRDNIAFARADVSDDEVRDPIRTVGLVEVIERLPEGIDTIVHERGQSLSSGERQLIALARAFVAQPRVLVLDEATSNLDLLSEAKIEGALDVLLEGRTAILIAHRLTTAMKADRIVVIDEGGIIEMGSHDELVARAAATPRCTRPGSATPRARPPSTAAAPHRGPRARSVLPGLGRAVGSRAQLGDDFGDGVALLLCGESAARHRGPATAPASVATTRRLRSCRPARLTTRRTGGRRWRPPTRFRHRPTRGPPATTAKNVPDSRPCRWSGTVRCWTAWRNTAEITSAAPANPSSTRPIHSDGMIPNRVMVNPHTMTHAAMALPWRRTWLHQPVNSEPISAPGPRGGVQEADDSGATAVKMTVPERERRPGACQRSWR